MDPLYSFYYVSVLRPLGQLVIKSSFLLIIGFFPRKDFRFDSFTFFYLKVVQCTKQYEASILTITTITQANQHSCCCELDLKFPRLKKKKLR